MIDPNIWTSEDVSKLDMIERLLLIGMFSNADDFGKGRANPIYLRSTIFPYDDIPVEVIQKGLDKISKMINIVFYEVDGSKYYKFTHWDTWQTVQKPQESRIPDPIDLVKNENEIILEQVENDSGMIQESVENDSGLKEKKRKEEEEKGKEDEEENESAATNEQPSDEPFKKIVDIFNKNIHQLTPVESEKLGAYLNDFDYEVIILAIVEAVTYNKRSMGYIQAVLNNWLNQGLKTKDDVESYLRDRQDKKQDSSEKNKNKNYFNDYSGQRKYDMKELEKQLLGRTGG